MIGCLGRVPLANLKEEKSEGDRDFGYVDHNVPQDNIHVCTRDGEIQ